MRTSYRNTTVPRIGSFRRDPKGSASAFTLVELLIVIGIIMLLVGILVPVVQSALIRVQVVRAGAIVQNLGAACESYKTATGYYPGQQYIDKVGQHASGSDVLTGSQCLARSLFVQGSAWAPSFDTDSVRVETNVDEQDNPSISDKFSEPMTILYFPARLGVKGAGQYDIDDNVQYLNGNLAKAQNDEWKKFVKDDQPGAAADAARNPDKFLITAAGEDRKYFTQDDLTYPNWTYPKD